MPDKINWAGIDTVLLDMDGPLLDLAFDRYFWLHRIPNALCEKQGLSPEQANQKITEKYHAVQHTLNWYCFDYWSRELGLDIRKMTWDLRHKIRLHPQTCSFLRALRQCGKRTILLTNAHPYNLDVKQKQTGLGNHLDLLLTTHTFGYPKEDQRLWAAVQQVTGFENHRTLFIDDSEPILDAARQWGIGTCLGVTRPDSGMPEKTYVRHSAVNDYRTLIAALTRQDPTPSGKEFQ